MNIEEKKLELLKKEHYDFNDLLNVVEILRAPGGCPWDAEQTHKSIREDFIEETYEVIEAIDNEDPVLLCEELGDVLLQVVFHTRIEEEKNSFTINEVTDGICSKLIHRHPHVFADVKVNGSAQVLDNWDKIKSEEKKRETVTDRLNAIPRQLPALMRAEKVGKKSKCFDFENAESVMSKLEEEKSELYLAIEKKDADNIEEEIGDLLLTITSLCRKLGVKPENALNRATDKFISRFSALENIVISKGMDINSMSMPELDAVWNENKSKNR